MLEQRAIGHAVEILDPNCFYNASHSWIFEAMLSLYERGVAVDQFTLAEELKRRDQLDDVGGVVYLVKLATQVATAANIDVHARILIEKALSRRLIETASDIIEQAYKGSGDVLELINRAEQWLFTIIENQIGDGVEPLETVMGNTLLQIERIHNRGVTVSAVETGFADLNAQTSGLQKGDLIVLAAQPSVGKTALALTLARNAAVDAGVGVVIFSPKMSRMQLARRLLSAETQVDLHKLCTGQLSDDDWMHLTRNIDRLAQAPIFIDDTLGISELEARAKARRLQRECGIGMVVIDYLQLMSGRVGTQSRERKILHILRRLKDLAKELDVPVLVLVLVQLSYAEESFMDPRPQLSDLPEGIGQAADMVIFIYRPDMYGLTSPDGESLESLAEIIIDKQRNGPPCSVTLRWNAECATYEPLVPI